MRSMVGGAVATALLASLLVAATTGGAQGRVTRLVDRTYVCVTEDYGGGFRRGDVWVNTRQPNGIPAVARFTSGRARDATAVGAEAANGGLRRRGGVYVSANRCRLTKLRVALSTRGLTGGATPLSRAYECDVPREVVVRIRASLRSAGRWHPIAGSPGTVGVQVGVRTVTVAVRTKSSPRPFGVAAFDDRGRASAYVSPRVCSPD